MKKQGFWIQFNNYGSMDYFKLSKAVGDLELGKQQICICFRLKFSSKTLILILYYYVDNCN